MKLATKTEPNLYKLQNLWSTGFRYIEIYTNREIISNTTNIELLKSFRFEYVVHAPTDYFDESVIDFTGKIGGKLINTHKIISDDMLQKLVKVARSKKILVSVENEAFPESHHLDHDGNQLPTIQTYDPVRSGGDFLRLQEKVFDLKLCVDVEHALIRKEYPSMINACYEFLGHIHLCGFTGGEHHRPVYENMELIQHLTTLLRKYKYSGFVVCEHDTKFHTPEVWKKTLKECMPLFGE